MQVSRTTAPYADRQLARDRSLAGVGKRGTLRVTNVLPGERAVAAHGVGEAVQRVPRQPVHTANAGVLQRLDDQIRDRACHRVAPGGSSCDPGRGDSERSCSVFTLAITAFLGV